MRRNDTASCLDWQARVISGLRLIAVPYVVLEFSPMLPSIPGFIGGWPKAA